MSTLSKTVKRLYLKRIIEIKKVISPDLTNEIRELGDKLGVGTYRLRDVPGLLVSVSERRESSGMSTDWKSVAWELAIRACLPPQEFARLTNKYTSFKSGRIGDCTAVSVRKDPCKPGSPKIKGEIL